MTRQSSSEKHCPLHDVVYPKTSTCPQCPTVDGEALAAVAPATLDKEIGLLEQELRTEARYYRKLARGLCADERQINVGLKAAEVSLKFERAYKELLAERKGREHDVWLVEQNRLLQGNGGA